jgi:hypothetical protein
MREDGAVSDVRVQHFSDPAFLARLGAGAPVPAVGWAIRADGDVFFDGVQVGRSGKYVFDRRSGTPYAEISYEALAADVG